MKRSTSILSSLLILLSWTATAQSTELAASVKRGQSVYMVNCQTCHMLAGEGIAGVFPPLAKSPRVSDKDQMIKVLLHGLKGPLMINGTRYNGEMASYEMLSDQEVSDVLNFIRNSFGNSNPAIAPNEIKAKRDK